MKLFKGIKGISIIEFDERDIIRHHLVKYIVNAYKKLDVDDKENK